MTLLESVHHLQHKRTIMLLGSSYLCPYTVSYRKV